MKVEVVFDFDCTLTTRHLYHTIRSGDKFLADLIVPKATEWDDISKQLVKKIQDWEDQLSIANFSDCQYDELFNRSFAEYLKGALDFSKWLMGGDQRLLKLTGLLSGFAKFHISTKGLVSEVKELLHNCGLLQFFNFIDGFDDAIEKRVVYQVQKEKYMINTAYHDKRAFILALMKSNPTAKIVYLDDDNEYYSSLREKFVTCVDIGPKESLDAFSTHQMKKLKNLIDFTEPDKKREKTDEKTKKHQCPDTDEKTKKRKCPDADEKTKKRVSL